MDTKSKRKIKPGWLAVLWLAALSVLVTACFPLFASTAAKNKVNIYEQDYFTDSLYENGYVLYWELMQKQSGRSLTPAEVFIEPVREALEERWDDDESFEDLEVDLLWTVTSWRDRFRNQWDGLEYVALLEDGTSVGYGSDLLRQVAESAVVGDLTQDMVDAFQYYVLIRYDAEGNLHTRAIYGAPLESMEIYEKYDMWSHWEYLFDNQSGVRRMELPSNMTVVYGIPRAPSGYNPFRYDQQFYQRSAFGNAGFAYAFVGLLAISVLTALVLGLGGKVKSRYMGWIPLEGLAVLVVLACACGGPLANIGASLYDGAVVLFDSQQLLTGTYALVMGYLLSLVLLLFASLTMYGSTLALLQIRDMGLWGYLRRRSVTGWLIVGLAAPFRWVYRWVTDIDLTQDENKTILKILLVNFVLLVILCSLWFFGIIALVIYTIILFIVLTKYAKTLRYQYGELMRVTGEMAHGRLNAKIGEDLGVFEPLSQELQKVQTGFRKAVEAEVKSQSMKTELVTNVSHDLKTPLTAIITYVDLLKDETITEEERRSYIETLDNKSQRLKALIEDLFEVSKANSGNVDLELAPVDLASLVRQVELEVKDAVEDSGIQFLHRYPEEKIMVLLDGEKTSRVFENLILNTTKYAMPGTRAYIDMIPDGGWVRVELKNISREPLDFDTGDITERFVRGDRSRNTEGSGLGLAIAKSFTELQGGSFHVVTDGDLFKAVVKFPVYNPPAEPEELSLI